jgi:hypothetical protein
MNVQAGPAKPTERIPPYPGIPVIMDGSEAIASVESRIAEGACAYPIAPSTNLATLFEASVANGRTNLWGTPLLLQAVDDQLTHFHGKRGRAVVEANPAVVTEAYDGLIDVTGALTRGQDPDTARARELVETR